MLGEMLRACLDSVPMIASFRMNMLRRRAEVAKGKAKSRLNPPGPGPLPSYTCYRTVTSRL